MNVLRAMNVSRAMNDVAAHLVVVGTCGDDDLSNRRRFSELDVCSLNPFIRCLTAQLRVPHRNDRIRFAQTATGAICAT
jgi:hypothetical protein